MRVVRRVCEEKHRITSLLLLLLICLLRCGSAACAACAPRCVRIKADDDCLRARASARDGGGVAAEIARVRWIYNVYDNTCAPDGLCRRSAPAAAAKTRGLVSRRV
jgi:hypothetical protein